MGEILLAQILWGEVAPRVNYLYGSKIHYHLQEVYFENTTFASGKVIKTWRSRTNYQKERRAPELPPLQAGQRYRLEQQLTGSPQGATYLQLQFYNRQGEEIGREILRGEEGTFLYPQETFTYTLKLVSAGCDSVTFQAINLYGPASPRLKENAFLDPDVSPDTDYQKILEFVQPLLEDQGVL